MDTMKTASSNKLFLAFGLGLLAGAAAMFCAGLLYLRHNLVLREEFPGVTADDLDDVLENEFPVGTGWHAVREDVPLPMPRDGRALFHWRLSPVFGALAMAASSLCVVTNALRLNRSGRNR